MRLAETTWLGSNHGGKQDLSRTLKRLTASTDSQTCVYLASVAHSHITSSSANPTHLSQLLSSPVDAIHPHTRLNDHGWVLQQPRSRHRSRASTVQTRCGAGGSASSRPGSSDAVCFGHDEHAYHIIAAAAGVDVEVDHEGFARRQSCRLVILLSAYKKTVLIVVGRRYLGIR